MSYIWSPHALKRLYERFDNPDVVKVGVDRTGVARRKEKKIIKKNCPVSAKKYMSKGYVGRYFLYSLRLNVVYIIEAPNIVVTAFELEVRGE